MRRRDLILVCVTACALAPATAPRAQAPAAPAVAAPGAFVDAGGARLYYEVRGRGPAVVLLHDGLIDSRIWDASFAALAASHRVVRYDRRGYGRSDPATAPYDPVEDLRRVLDRAGVARAALVGSSSGSALAIAFALEHPGRVDALVLGGPVVGGFGYSQHFADRGAANNRPLAAGDSARAAANWAADPYLVGGPNPRARARVRAWLAERPGPLSLRVDLIQGPMRTRPSRGRLGEIAVPTLLLVGERDIPDVHAHAGAIQAGIAGAERVVIPGAGHLLPLEPAAALAQRVEAFLARPPAAPPAHRLP